MPAMNLFKPKPTPKEAAMAAKKETKREIRQQQREMDRTLRDLDKQEKQLLAEIKKRAKTNPSKTDSILRTLSKQLVQIRAQRDKIYSTKSQLGSIGMNANMVRTQKIFFLQLTHNFPPLT